MTHELLHIFDFYSTCKLAGTKSVLVTVVDLVGSSYRKPGVRMLIMENGESVGAISGGCVEKDVKRQAQMVLETNQPIMMAYDGRFKLGCEGTIGILIEPFAPSADLLERFNSGIKDRESFKLTSPFSKNMGVFEGPGTSITFTESESFLLNGKESVPNLSWAGPTFTEHLPPCFKLVIIGTEHDAVQLCVLASLTGWEVTVVCSPNNPKSPSDFPGATHVVEQSAEQPEELQFDSQTAVVLMSHSYAKDLKHLIALQSSAPLYLGILGAKKRFEKLLSDFMDFCPELESEFLDRIHGPTGLDIGGITPQEIAISIIAEILSIHRSKQEEDQLVSAEGVRFNS
jgi:xanthine dehydrogenase accessory factor